MAASSQEVGWDFGSKESDTPDHFSREAFEVVQPSKRIRLTDEPCIVAM